MMNRLLGALYLGLGFVILSHLSFFLNKNPAQAEFIMFATPFSEWLRMKAVFIGVYLLTLASTLVCSWRPSLGLRIFVCLLFLLLSSMKFSFGKVNHSEHIWMMSLLFACVFSEKKSLASRRNQTTLRLMQTALLSIYFISGLWKLRDLGFSGWGRVAKENMAYAIAEGSGPPEFLQSLLLIEFPWVTTVGFAFVILFQMSAIIPVVTLKGWEVWGLFAVLFHFTTGVVMGIWFKPTILAAILLLIYFQRLLEADNKVCRLS